MSLFIWLIKLFNLLGIKASFLVFQPRQSRQIYIFTECFYCRDLCEKIARGLIGIDQPAIKVDICNRK